MCVNNDRTVGNFTQDRYEMYMTYFNSLCVCCKCVDVIQKQYWNKTWNIENNKHDMHYLILNIILSILEENYEYNYIQNMTTSKIWCVYIYICIIMHEMYTMCTYMDIYIYIYYVYGGSPSHPTDFNTIQGSIFGWFWGIFKPPYMIFICWLVVSTILKNMSSSMGRMTSHILWKINNTCETTNQF